MLSPQYLFDGLSSNLLYNASSIADEHSSQADAFFIDQHAVVPCNAMIGIAQERYVDMSRLPKLTRHVLPVAQNMLDIDRNG